MKFQKGSKVEVMNKTELPTSWCVAEIVSGNRHTYNLRYDCYPGVEKVSREFIRPCPPRSKEDFQSWIAGDIVEVFDENSWKTATVCKITDQGHFSVRPHGFTHERNVPKSEIRTRQSWQDGHWVPIVKISGSYGDVNAKNCQENDNDTGFQESRVVSSKTLKRASPFCSSPGNAKKLKEHRRRLIPNQSLEKLVPRWYLCKNSAVAACSVGVSIPIWIGLLVGTGLLCLPPCFKQHWQITVFKFLSGIFSASIFLQIRLIVDIDLSEYIVLMYLVEYFVISDLETITLVKDPTG